MYDKSHSIGDDNLDYFDGERNALVDSPSSAENKSVHLFKFSDMSELAVQGKN